MCEQELLERFNRASLPQSEWTHQAHLKVALQHLREMTAPEAMVQLREKIQKLNLFHQVFTTPERGYHETRTRVWVAVLSHALKKRAQADLVARYAHRDVALEHYQSSTLDTWQARIGWVKPDKAPLPVDPGSWGETPELFTYPAAEGAQSC